MVRKSSEHDQVLVLLSVWFASCFCFESCEGFAVKCLHPYARKQADREREKYNGTALITPSWHRECRYSGKIHP